MTIDLLADVVGAICEWWLRFIGPMSQKARDLQ